jgi:hypothetical protein
MDYRTIEERIAYRLGQIDGLLQRRSFEEDLVLALTCRLPKLASWMRSNGRLHCHN